MMLLERIGVSRQEVATTIITVEEQLRGWLAEIHRLTDPRRQILAYEPLQRRIEFFAAWAVLPWNPHAADLFVRYRREGVRIGSLDLKDRLHPPRARCNSSDSQCGRFFQSARLAI